MERQLLHSLYLLARALVVPSANYRKQFPDQLIVTLWLWAVLSDRPRAWALRRENLPPECRDWDLPSQGTLSRRLRSPSVLLLIVRVFGHLQEGLPRSEERYLDSRPLTVGNASGDRDARPGWAAGAMARGYKQHVLMQRTGRVEALLVVPMNVGDAAAGAALIGQLPYTRGVLAGDTSYDANGLYDLAARHGLQLVATPRPRAKGLGHRRHSPYRLHGLRIAGSPAGRRLLRDRFAIDRQFGHWGNVPGGLCGLPNHVRGLHRVRLWVVGKLICVYGQRCRKQRTYRVD